MTDLHATIPLVDRHGYTVANAKVDADLVGWLSQWEWNLNSKGYAIRWCPHQSAHVRMHRLIQGAISTQDADITVDHINGDRLDNRRANLRWATYTQQMINRSKNRGRRFKGVFKNPNCSTCTVRIGARGQRYYFGSFRDEVEAAKKYDLEALRIWGPDYPRLNFPELRGEYLARLPGS